MIDGFTPLVYVRTAGRPEAFINAVRQDLGLLDRQVALRQASLGESLDSWYYAQPRFSLIVLGIFAVAGLLLVTIGVYSVIAYTVSRQMQEIAVRLALGARRRQVCGTVLGRAGILIGAGICVGLAASLATGRLIASQLWNTPLRATSRTRRFRGRERPLDRPRVVSMLRASHRNRRRRGH